MAMFVIWVVILAKYYTFKTILLLSPLHLINLIIYLIYCYNVTFCSAGFNSVTYPGLKWIKRINQIFLNTMNDKEQIFVNHIILQKCVENFIIQHNNFCNVYQQIFKLISKAIFEYYLTIMPISLILIHQVFFEKLPIEYRLIYILDIVIIFYITIVCQYIYAHLSRLTHRTAVPMSRFQWRIKGLPFGLRHKIKVMSYFERLSSNRKIGVTIGPTITLTIPVFSQVHL